MDCKMPQSSARNPNKVIVKASILAKLEKRVLWLATWMIHNANHNRAAGEVRDYVDRLSVDRDR